LTGALTGALTEARSTGALSVVVVDDHPVTRFGVVAMLTQQGIKVIGEAATGAQAVEVVATTRPDVLVTDLRLGEGLDGVGVTEAVRRLPHPPAVLVLTTYDTDRDIVRAVEAGAAGYLLKDAPPEQIVAAVRAAATGDTVLSDALTERVIARMRDGRLADLSARQVEILRLVAQGNTNKEIARSLYISEATVKTHLVHVFGKLGAESRTAAVSIARAEGLLD
jgi:DNA-binding NarL/FixJ family response regulator